MTIRTLMKRPSAFLPVAMSVAALAIVFIQLAAHGAAPQADEGAAAHIFQLLMVAQLPIVAFFAISWVPRAPKQALGVLAIQACAGIAAFAPIYFLHW